MGFSGQSGGGYNINPLDMPASAGPQDRVVGVSEFGVPVYETATGQRYSVRSGGTPNPAPEQQPKDRGLLSDIRRAARSAPEALRTGEISPTARGLLDGIVQGFTAPGRAMAGEPVTLGDAWATALDYGGVSNLAPAPAGALRAGNVRTGIRAYHGSPHDFDRFDMSKIGTGEGAQAYGHGLYFAEAEDVARMYRDALAGQIDNQKVTIDGQIYEPPTSAHQRAAAIIAKDGRGSAFDVLNSGIRQGYMDEATERAYRDVLNLTAKKDVRPVQSGRMYEVNIAANPDDFLDWDAPITESPVAFQDWVRARMDSADLPEGSRRQRQLQNWRGAPGDWQAPEGANVPPPRVAEARNWLANYGETQAEMTEALREAGIPGIKYLDQGSRGAGQGTRNFVVFDDSLISIIRKYGIAAVAAGLGLSQADLQAQAAEQGIDLQQPQGLLQ